MRPYKGARVGRAVLLWRWGERQFTLEKPVWYYRWRCRCACGREFDVAESMVHLYVVLSCGCFERDRRRVRVRRRRTVEDVFWETKDLARVLEVPWDEAWREPVDLVAEVGFPTWDQDLWPVELERGYVRDNVRWRNIDLLADRVRRMGLEEALRRR